MIQRQNGSQAEVSCSRSWGSQPRHIPRRNMVERERSADIALLTGGGDRPYALGMATMLTSAGLSLDFIGSDDLKAPELLSNPQIRFLNLRGIKDPEASFLGKVLGAPKFFLGFF